jgi:hypothetical protein
MAVITIKSPIIIRKAVPVIGWKESVTHLLGRAGRTALLRVSGERGHKGSGSILEGDIVPPVVGLIHLEVVKIESEQPQEAISDGLQPVHHLRLSLLVQLFHYFL